MQTFLNDPQLKEDLLKQIEWHREQDAIIQGTYSEGSGDNWRGCAVGCSIHSLNKLKNKRYKTDDHSVYEKALGLPEWLARLEDTIFEGLPIELAKEWPERLTKAIPVGVDLSNIKWQFCAYLLHENIDRVLSLNIDDDLKQQVVDAIRGVLSLHENALRTGNWDESAAESAESAAWSAAWSAARSAESAARSAESAAWSAAWSAESAAWSAESAARSAARSAESAAWSAESAPYEKHANKLIELLEAA